MSFDAADLVARIQLGGVDTVSRDLDRVRGKLTDTDSVASKLGKTAEAVFRGAATTIGVASAAAAVYVGKLFATGAAYNQLQQTSRAAMRTLMGGAEAANAQMDKLDAFARNSPFSKSVFISAQQQLIGFGFEAQKVIPILDAVQNSVAAVGGSNEQISDIVSILAKIRSSGKLTAEDFNMLGERGLDAATLLGQGFGKSAAEIRESVTKGTLDAGQAIDVLVNQMGTKFAGAASNVKETFAGTKDRIAAASRDIGSALAEPFVSKNGGGLAVVWGNQVADVMRAVESHTTPVVSILMDRAMPAFAGITELLDRARVQVKAWDSSRLESGLNAVSDNAPGLAALAGAVLGVNSQLLASIPVVGRFVPAFGPLGGAIAGAALASPQLRKELGSLLGELKPLLPVTVNLATTMSGALNAALPIVAGGIRAVVAVAGPLADILEDIPSPMLATAAAGVAVYAALRSGSPAIQSFVEGLRRIADQAAVQAALAGMERNAATASDRFQGAAGASGSMSTAFGVAGSAATGLGNSLKAAFISNPVGLIILGVSTAAAILTATLSAQGQKAQEVEKRIRGYRETLTATGEVTADTVDKIRQSISEFSEVETNIFSSGTLTKAKDWVDGVGGAERALLKFGQTSDTIADAIRDGGSAYDELLASLREYGSETEKVRMPGGIKEQYTDQANAANLLADAVEEQGTAVQLASEIQAAANERTREAAANMSEAQRSTIRMNEALRITSDVGADATSRLQAYKQVLDELRGGTRSQADLTQELNDQVRSLSEAFAATDENGNRLASTLVKADGEIDTTTDAGSRLRTQVQGLGDDYLNAMRTASDAAVKNGEYGVSLDEARAIHERYATALAESARAAGLGEEAIAALVSATLDQPEFVATTFSSNATEEKTKAMDLALQILATPDGQFDISSASLPGVMDALTTLGVKTETLPDGTVRVFKDDGSFSTVLNALANIPRDIRVRVSSYYGGGVNMNPDIPGFKRAGGGPIFGPGTATSDSIPALLSNGEHVLPTAEVQAAGGHAGVMRIRRAIRDHQINIPRFAEGGPVFPLRGGAETMLRLAPSTSSPVGLGAADLGLLIAEVRSLRESLGRPNVSITEVNPVHTDPISDRIDEAKLRGASI